MLAIYVWDVKKWARVAECLILSTTCTSCFRTGEGYKLFAHPQTFKIGLKMGEKKGEGGLFEVKAGQTQSRD